MNVYPYVGGLVGCSSRIIIQSSYNAGVIVSQSAVTYAGGLIGYAMTTTDVLTNCYYLNDIDKPVGNNRGTLTNIKLLSDDEMREQISFEGFDFETVWEIPTNGRPVFLSMQCINDANDDCPIIILPGIMGSQLYKDKNCTDTVWIPSMNVVIIGNFLSDNMPIEKGLYVKPPKEQHPLADREYGAQDAYRELANYLCDAFPEKEIYFFSYDFRKSNAETAKELEKFIIDERFSSVDLVCHSMGDIVAANFMQTTANPDRVRKIITCGTPYMGSPLLPKIADCESLEPVDTGGLQDSIARHFSPFFDPCSLKTS